MTNTLTLKKLTGLMLLILGLNFTLTAQVFWTETFADDNGPASPWKAAAIVNGGTENWTWTNNPTAGYQDPNVPAFASPTATNGYFLFDSDKNGDFDHDVTLTGAAINATGKKDVRLRLYSQYAYFSPDSTVALVGVSTDGGLTFKYHELFEALAPNEVGQGFVEVDLDEADNQASVILQFRWKGHYEYHWKIDDLTLFEFTKPSSNVTFRVNMLTSMVDPAGVFIAGSFTNWADAPMQNQGNGVWAVTLPLEQGLQIQYKFKNGPNGWENVTAQCGVSDGFGGFNRGLTVPTTDITLPIVCINSCTNCDVPCDQNPMKIVCDNFETYDVTKKLGPQATHWTTWSGTENTTEDGIVSTEQASSGTKSLKINSTATAGGPQDVVLNLGNKGTGRYELTWKVYVPAGKNAYYNLQEVVPIPATNPTGNWNLDVFFENDSIGRVVVEQVERFRFKFAYNSWVTVTHILDLDNNIMSYYINNQLIGKAAFLGNLGGVDFYGTNNVSTFYIDDVEYVQMDPVTYNVDQCDAAVDLTAVFGGAPGVAQTTGIFSNTTATTSTTDPAAPDCFLDGISQTNPTPAPALNATMWYTFSGDGNRYHIETVPCTVAAADYIDDTQMALYTGGCGNLTQLICNEDVSPDGNPDFRAGLDIDTEAGKEYQLLIDAWSNLAGQYVQGDFCIEVTQLPKISCAAGSVGTYTVDNNGFVCFNTNLNELITLSSTGFTIPTVGPVYGMAWAVTQSEVPTGTWPVDLGTAYFGSTGVLDAPFAVGLANDGSFTPGIYYITPVIIGGGTVIDPTMAIRLENVDVSNGCFFVGVSEQALVLPELSEIIVEGVVTAPTGGLKNGAITVELSGGFPGELGDPTLFETSWTGPNGFTSSLQSITGLAAGTYVLTVKDPSGCVSDAVETFTVGTIATKDPASVKALSLTPNPTSGELRVQLSLATAAEVRMEVINTLGQVMFTQAAGSGQSIAQTLDLSNLSEGAYFLRLTINGETAVRRVVVQH